MSSEMFKCPKGKQIKEFFHGTVTKYAWDEVQKCYVATNEQRSIYFCWHCNPECVPEICQFTDTDQIASQG